MIDFSNNSVTKDVKVFTPLTLQDSTNIIDFIKHEPCVVSLEKLKTKNVQRFIDILSGACYGLGVFVCPLDKLNYLFTKQRF